MHEDGVSVHFFSTRALTSPSPTEVRPQTWHSIQCHLACRCSKSQFFRQAAGAMCVNLGALS